jgi:hypothetical protein
MPVRSLGASLVSQLRYYYDGDVMRAMNSDLSLLPRPPCLLVQSQSDYLLILMQSKMYGGTKE